VVPQTNHPPSTPWSGIYCLEGQWEERDVLDRSSVLPVLELLERYWAEEVGFVHRTVSTFGEFEHYLDRWVNEAVPYYVVYLAFHGTTDGIRIPDARIEGAPKGVVTLEYLGKRLGDQLGDCVVHFGSCSVMAASPSRLDRFLRATGATAVMGYSEEVKFMDSAAMDLIALSNIVAYERVGDILGKKGLGSSRYASFRRKPIGFRARRHPDL